MGPSDTRLTELLRADTATSYQALQELRSRHRSPVLSYARLCTTSEPAARQLAGQAFTLAARETARGIDPGVPWRHRLLLLTVRLARSWATDERAGGLDPGLLLVMNTAGPAGPVPPMLSAFQSLPSRAQGLIWYGVVEQEPVNRTAGFLGLRREDVEYGTEQALQAMGQACLRSRLAASDDPRCGDFRRLIEESVRPDNPRFSADLHAHMVQCAHCTAAYEELTALRDAPRTALAEGLLPWGGTAYTEHGVSEPHTHARTAEATWPPSRRLALASAALGLTLAPLLVFLLSSGDSPDQRAASSSVSTPADPPAVTVTATVSVSPSASPTPSPSPSATSKSPSPTRSSKPPKPRPKPTPTAHAPNGAFAQVVNAASGLCLEVAGDFDNGTDVAVVGCTSSSSQRWRFDSERSVLQSSADPDFCLDSRGSVDNGVGIWHCDSVYGRNGQNLRFTVDDDGVVRPAIAVETALTPDGDGGLALHPLTGDADQRWRAGAL
ncbi:ricin-type beta-trefoil lectin domain protein [Streptomyces chiangmaiensis]|uniref:RICIN domain-containing protein n=2 Tax=Streptomyces chiangmaiensis TaxID=766497 RepID=A0ABU7FB08_9ACTN|nr:RICIN domain-containing protein [Streptomyces chiangmaiensis]MED7821161.1 RICIN domain-containing protein [Streptomyces chiangmaiensis]